MKKIRFLLFFLIMIGASSLVNAQKVNGRSFTFSQGKGSWSDTIFRKIQTKNMADEKIPPVMLAIRYHYVKPLTHGYVYELEITNASPTVKIKFRILANKNSESFTIRLEPAQTKIYRRTYWTSAASARRTGDHEILFDFPTDELIHNRD